MKMRKHPLVIFAYHGLIPSTSMALNDFCFVTPEKIESDLAKVRKNGWSLVRLHEGIARLKDTRLDGPAVAITFDDGFWNVVQFGSELFERHNIVPTIFIPTDSILKRKQLWYTRIISAISVTEMPTFEFLGRHFSIKTAREKSVVSKFIQDAFKQLHPHAIECLVADLEESLNISSPEESVFRLLTADECKREVERARFDFAPNSASHAIHSRLNQQAIETEVADSIAAIKLIQAHPFHIYAYPNGSWHDITDACPEILARSGVSYGLTTQPGWNVSAAQPFYLRRFCIGQHTDVDKLLTSVRWRFQAWIA